MALALREDKEYTGLEIVIERPDGSRRTALAHTGLFHQDSGEISGGINILIDITSHKGAEPGR